MNPKYEPCISKIERVMAILAGQGKTKSHKLKFFKSRYLTEFLRQGPKILHVIITFIGFKITFSNIGSHMTPQLISRRGRSAPPPRISQLSQTSGLKGLRKLYIIPDIDIIGANYFLLIEFKSILSLNCSGENNC